MLRAMPPAELSRRIEELMGHHRIPGAQVAVLEGGKLAWTSGFGVLEAGREAPVTERSLFQTASVSKPVAAFIALALVQEGRLALDEDVNARLKGWKVPEGPVTAGSKVTLRRLLSHTAGLTVHGYGGLDHSGTPPTPQQLLDAAWPGVPRPAKLMAVPGSMWKYSGAGYVMFEQLVLDVIGRPFPEMAQPYLERWGMIRSTFEQPLPEKWRAESTSGHWRDTIIRPGEKCYAAAAGGLRATAADLAAFCLALIGSAAGGHSAPVKPELVRQMLTAQGGAYGLGLQLERPPPADRVFHNGKVQGHEAQVFASVGKGRGAVVLANGNSETKFQVAVLREIGRAYGWTGPLADARGESA